MVSPIIRRLLGGPGRKMFFPAKTCLVATLVCALTNVAFAQQSNPLDNLLESSSDMLQQNQIEAAIALLESGATEYADSIEVRNNLAIAYLGADRYDEAVALLQSLSQQDRELPIIQHNLAEVEGSNRGQDPVDPIIFIERAPVDEPEVAAEAQQPAESRVETNSAEPPPVQTQLNAVLIPASETPTVADIRNMVEAWAAAWSSKSYREYISFYANDFQPRDRSYADWLAFREEMVTKPGPISLQLENFDISVYSYEIRARFDQDYDSDDYRDDIRKLLVIDRRDGFWKIVREATLEVY